MKTIDEILLNVEKPSRYIGGEFGEPEIKTSKFNYCICFPDVYEVALSNLGIRIVADVINNVDGAMADRCYAPWPDFGSQLKENGIPLFFQSDWWTLTADLTLTISCKLTHFQLSGKSKG